MLGKNEQTNVKHAFLINARTQLLVECSALLWNDTIYRTCQHFWLLFSCITTLEKLNINLLLLYMINYMDISFDCDLVPNKLWNSFIHFP